MKRTQQFFQSLTAGEVMNRAGVVLPHWMSVGTAARLLLEAQVRAAPVTDAQGKCVGVLSATDLLRWAADRARAGERGPTPTESVWCDWQVLEKKPNQADEVS